jgi:Rieske 2Fe-2S family protein
MTEPQTKFLGEMKRLKDVISVDDKLSQRYYDDVIENVFKPSWFLLGNMNDVPDPGSYFVYDIPTFKASVIVMRDERGQVQAFHNVCRHRGKKVVTTHCGWAEGKSPRHTCWFHGWTYSSDGRLMVVPDERAFTNLYKEELGLVPIRSETWAGLIFAYFGDGEPQPLCDWLGELADGFENYYTGMEKIATVSADVDANWNFAMDGFSEGYHTVFLHRNTQPELAGKDNPMRHAPVVDLYARHIRQSGVANPDYKGPPAEQILYKRGRKLSPAVETDYSTLPEGVNRTRHAPWFFDVVWWFPNMAILNGVNWVSVLTIWPIDKDRTRLITDHYAKKARHAGDRLAQAYMRGLIVSVTREDLGALEEVQAGLISGAIKNMYVSRQEMVLQKRYALINDILEEASQ